MYQITKLMFILAAFSMTLSCNKQERLQEIENIEGIYKGKMMYEIIETDGGGFYEVVDTTYDLSAYVELIGNDSIGFRIGGKGSYYYLKRDTNLYQQVYDKGGLRIEIVSDTLKYYQAFDSGFSGSFSHAEIWKFEGTK